MCPACITTAALIAAGTISSSAVGALLVRKSKATQGRTARPAQDMEHASESGAAASDGSRE